MKNLVKIILCICYGDVFAGADNCIVPAEAKLPDLLSVVPQQIGLQNAQQQEIIRFSNSIANLGPGLWWLEPEFPENDDVSLVQSAYQVFSNSTTITDVVPPAEDAPEYLGRCKKGDFAFHPTHNHWHINHVAEFKVCDAVNFEQNKADGHPDQCNAVPINAGVAASVKVTFCLIDWIKLGENTSASDPSRNFWECQTGYQGTSPGWVDQYHHSTPDQQIFITGIEPGDYYIVTTANYDRIFEETNKTNNTSWVKIGLARDSKGNPKITELATACDDPGYLSSLTATVNNYTGDTLMRQKILGDMCGNMSTNK